MENLKSITSQGLITMRSRAGAHIHQITSNKSEVRSVDPRHATNDEDLLAQIGYKQELKRHYSTIQVFGIAFSIMGLLPSISTILASGLEGGPSALVWGWFSSGFFILLVGLSMSILSSSIPTSGGLFYWTNYYCPDYARVPLSFVIGCSNSLSLVGGACAINYGFASEVLAAVAINSDFEFKPTDPMLYGVFAAAVISHVVLCCVTTSHTATLQSFSICINCFIIVLFFIAVPIGASKHGFNDASFIFGKIDNTRTWSTGWSFMLSWQPAIWTIGAFDSCLHLAEEAKNASRSIPFGICGSISVCWIVGWCICMVCAACIKDGDIKRVLETETSNAMAQIIYDALGKQWAVAFMALIAFAQYLMGASILVAASRQVWAFARDDGLPFVFNYVKVVHPKLHVPLRATAFCAILGLLLGLLILIGPVAANALFSLGIAGGYLAWSMPVVLVLMPHGSKKFTPGTFYPGAVVTKIINVLTVAWSFYVIIMVMFPDNKTVTRSTMNYTCVVNGGVWFLALAYYYIHGYKFYGGPKSNLEFDSPASHSIINIDELIEEKT